jgi:hypothetical protein
MKNRHWHERDPPPLPRPEPVVRPVPPELHEPPPIPRMVRVVDVHPPLLNPVRHDGVRPREAVNEPPVGPRSETEYVRVRAHPHRTKPCEDALRSPAPGGHPVPHGRENRPRIELPKLILPEHGEQVWSGRKVRERWAWRTRRLKVQEGSGRHSEAEALSIHESVEPVENLSSTGSFWNQTDRVAEAEAIASRVEFVAISFQPSAFSFLHGYAFTYSDARPAGREPRRIARENASVLEQPRRHPGLS